MKKRLYEELGNNYKPALKPYEYKMYANRPENEVFEENEKFEL